LKKRANNNKNLAENYPIVKTYSEKI
jgi:hypothetical protein